MKVAKTLALAVVASGLWSAAPSFAQPLGTFRWQLQPYCNVITVAVAQQDLQYQMDGTDDQCGAAQAASVRGMAFPNPNGTIGLGLSIVTTPGGAPVHVDAMIALSTLNGSWRDSAGNTGTFVFTPGPATPGGGPRPVPSGGLAPGSVTTVQLAPAAVTNAQIAANAVTGANIADGSITTADLQGAPRASFASGEQVVTLTGAEVTIRSVTLPIPGPGRVIANATATVGFLGTSTTVEMAQCSLAGAASLDLTHQVVAGDGGAAVANTYVPMAIARGFNVTSGSFTVYLVCREFSGDVEIRNSSLTAFFVGS